jgi:hydroxyacylglutathione hydrolase
MISIKLDIMTNIIPIPAFKDNYIWALHDGQHAIVVDPGDATPVLNWLGSNNLTLSAILCTHHHNDHVGGVCELAGLYNVPVYGPRLDVIPCLTHQVGDGDIVEIAELNIRLQVLFIPGHTLGHIAYVTLENEGRAVSLFCGDTLFACGCGRLFEGTPAEMHHSLQRLALLPDSTRVYCAHEYTEANIGFALACEPDNIQLQQRKNEAHKLRLDGKPTLPSTIALEKATNPFLRCTEPEIIRALQGHGLTENHELAAFTALREWKNHF